MRSIIASLLVVSALVVACGGPATTNQPGSGTVSVTLTGGADAGTYTGSDNPNCSNGAIGPDFWGVQYSVADGPADQLSSVQVISAAPGMADDEDATFPGTEFKITVTIGTLFAEESRDYEIEVLTENADDESSGTGSAQVTDSGATAVIVATGTTADGVGIQATVTCPSVIRV